MKQVVGILLGCLLTIPSFSLNPSRTYKQRPEKYNMDYEEVKVTTSDGAVLNVWEFAAKNKSKNTILISHNGEGNMADYLRRVDQFSQTMNVVIYDYRGYGESSEFEIDNKRYIYPHFQDDLKAMIEHCSSEEGELFLYGWGIGAGLSLGIGWQSPSVSKIIADTPFLSMENIEDKLIKSGSTLIVPLAGYEKKHEPINAVSTSPGNKDLQVLLIIGDSDVLMDEADMKSLQKAGKKNIDKEIFIVENPDRKDNFRVDKAAYVQRIQEFISQ